ncbi:MAG: hypothetical protein ABJM06_01950 [Gilvibacter sp.]
MSILYQLSSFKEEKGNAVNVALAKRLAKQIDAAALNELVAGLHHQDKKVAHDCIKVLYEIGYLNPQAITAHTTDFIALLQSKDNRMVWGAMIAISTLTTLNHQQIYSEVEAVNKVITNGSTITIDNGVRIYAQLNCVAKYRTSIEPLLVDILWNCPFKQLPLYMEVTRKSIDAQNKGLFIAIINNRLPESEKDSQKKRLVKVLESIQKL